jgi:hypothetical protein
MSWTHVSRWSVVAAETEHGLFRAFGPAYRHGPGFDNNRLVKAILSHIGTIDDNVTWTADTYELPWYVGIWSLPRGVWLWEIKERVTRYPKDQIGDLCLARYPIYMGPTESNGSAPTPDWFNPKSKQG